MPCLGISDFCKSTKLFNNLDRLQITVTNSICEIQSCLDRLAVLYYTIVPTQGDKNVR